MDNTYIKTNVEGLVKDPKSGAILNVDNNALEAFKKQKMFAENTKKANGRINRIETEMIEIKSLLKQLLREMNK
jgi:hypothetical protein